MIGLIAAAMIAGACLWMVYLSWSAGDRSGAWLFAAFAFLFGVPAAALLKNLMQKKDSAYAPPAGIRFVPHWQLMAMIGIALLAILMAVVVSLLR